MVVSSHKKLSKTMLSQQLPFMRGFLITMPLMSILNWLLSFRDDWMITYTKEDLDSVGTTTLLEKVKNTGTSLVLLDTSFSAEIDIFSENDVNDVSTTDSGQNSKE